MQLGRHVDHDESSRFYPAQTVSATPRSILWDHRAPVLDQGDLGSCTGNAMAQLINCTAFAHTRSVTTNRFLTEADAVTLYSQATHLDGIPYNTYPPIDNGSSGLGVAKAAKAEGFLTGYTHAFGFPHLLSALQLQPVIVGTNWYEGMFTPSATGVVKVAGAIAGGHEYLVLGADITTQQVICLNSWGSSWGVGGRFRVSFADFSKLLAAQGDVTVPIGR